MCEAAFCKLKELLVTAPLLAYPHFGPDRDFILETDASGIELGAVLSQKQDDGHLHPIAYASRSLNPHEKNYCISELETLGLVWAVRYFRPYLLGHHTIVYTDHSACLSLFNTPHPSGKLARWALTIQEMNLTLKHRSGRQNVNADALSRNPVTNSIPISNENENNSNKNENLDALQVSGISSQVQCCDSVCPVCFHCSVCSVFASVAEPDNSDTEPISTSSDSELMSVSSDSEPMSMFNCAPQPAGDVDGASEPISVCSSECSSSSAGDCFEVKAGKQVTDHELKESLKEVQGMQLRDPHLALYVTYSEHHTLPDDDRIAKRIVLESRRMEIIDGVLYREDVSNPGQWCIVVPKPSRQELLEENHSTVFAGHFSERKVYDRLRRTYWWSGMRADV